MGRDEFDSDESFSSSSSAKASVSDQDKTGLQASSPFAALLAAVLLVCLVVALVNLSNVTRDNERAAGTPKGRPCYTAGCRRLAHFLQSYINRSIDPCDDFYGYVCSKSAYTNTFKKVKNTTMDSLVSLLHTSTVPEQGQSAMQKMVALFRACVSLARENRSEGGDLREFLVSLRLNPTSRGRSAGDPREDPLDVMLKLSVEYGLHLFLEFSTTGNATLSRYHKLAISEDYKEWCKKRANLTDTNSLTVYVTEYVSVLAPPWSHQDVLSFSHELISLENDVIVFLAQAEQSLEQAGQPKSLATKIRSLGKFTRNAVSSERWISAIQRWSEEKSMPEDTILTEHLALWLSWHLLGQGRWPTTRRLMVWGLLRKLAPYASARHLPRGGHELDSYCVKRVAHYAELAIMAVHLYRTVTPSVLGDAERMAKSLRTAFANELQASDWLRGEPRKTALRKIAAMRMIIGFPKGLSRTEQLDEYYAQLPDLSSRQFLWSWLELMRFQQLKRRSSSVVEADALRVGKVNAYYSYGNRVWMSAGLIQAPIYFNHAPDAYNFGSLGQAIGHEIMHAYDVGGRNVDDEGRRRDWWSNETNFRYQENALCIRHSHEQVLKQRTWLLRGELDSENLADFAGASAAIRAYSALPPGRRLLTVPGFRPDQLFFVAQCVKWCAPLDSYRPGSWHGRARSRCIVPLMHMRRFSKAFRCAKGAYMNPKKKCRFW
ncbi:neprilysin-1-like [Amblyomma americanum]